MENYKVEIKVKKLEKIFIVSVLENDADKTKRQYYVKSKNIEEIFNKELFKDMDIVEIEKFNYVYDDIHENVNERAKLYVIEYEDNFDIHEKFVIADSIMQAVESKLLDNIERIVLIDNIIC